MLSNLYDFVTYLLGYIKIIPYLCYVLMR